MSSKIHILPETVASKIAAGEIIERPAAVVKELVDNSLDAGSLLISVDVQEGGKRLICVTDDGEGMSPVDARLACQRFATSKLQTEDDLFHIQTFGFRGEALPSIAAVSRFELLTSRRGDPVGTCLRIDAGGEPVESRQAAAPGTRIIVRDLFYNTPVRLKFLKSPTTEFSHICHVVQQAALIRHQTHFKLLHNGKLVFEYPAVTEAKDRLQQVYGSQFLNTALPVRMASSHVRIEGIAIDPVHTRASKVPQEIFVNSRPVKNSTIVHAIYEAYAPHLPKGRHPVYAIFVDVDAHTIDVNVHPTKREIKFAQPDIIHAAVRNAISAPLRKTHPIGDLLQPVNRAVPGKQNQSPTPRQRSSVQPNWDLATQTVLDISSSSEQTGVVRHADDQVRHEPVVSDRLHDYGTSMDHHVVALGQIFQTFLVARVDSELHIIDQHTVHERVLFERLWREWRNRLVVQQPLLIPEPIELPLHAGVILNEYLDELRGLGMEIEPFGASSFVVRGMPAILGSFDFKALLVELVDDLAQWKSHTSLDQKIKPIMASMACQSAVQAGRNLEHQEIHRVVHEWAQEGFPMTCPHGRRIAMRFSQEELNRIFGRA